MMLFQKVYYIQSNLVIRNKLVIRNHFLWPIVNLLHKDDEHLALRNNFRETKKFLITKGQLILKENCQAVNSSKRRTIELLLCHVFSFVFWKKLKSPKSHFGINWPLNLTVLHRKNLVFFGPIVLYQPVATWNSGLRK